MTAKESQLGVQPEVEPIEDPSEILKKGREQIRTAATEEEALEIEEKTKEKIRKNVERKRKGTKKVKPAESEDVERFKKTNQPGKGAENVVIDAKTQEHKPSTVGEVQELAQAREEIEINMHEDGEGNEPPPPSPQESGGGAPPENGDDEEDDEDENEEEPDQKKPGWFKRAIKKGLAWGFGLPGIISNALNDEKNGTKENQGYRPVNEIESKLQEKEKEIQELKEGFSVKKKNLKWGDRSSKHYKDYNEAYRKLKKEKKELLGSLKESVREESKNLYNRIQEIRSELPGLQDPKEIKKKLEELDTVKTEYTEMKKRYFEMDRVWGSQTFEKVVGSGFVYTSVLGSIVVMETVSTAWKTTKLIFKIGWKTLMKTPEALRRDIQGQDASGEIKPTMSLGEIWKYYKEKEDKKGDKK